MRVWDIVDKVYSDVEFTQVRSARRRVKAVISSAIQCAIVMGVVLGTSAHIKTSRENFVSNSTVRFQRVTHQGAGAEPRSLGRKQRIQSSTDTQFGQSTSRLANTFPAFFQPAPDEDEFDIDYSFS